MSLFMCSISLSTPPFLSDYQSIITRVEGDFEVMEGPEWPLYVSVYVFYLFIYSPFPPVYS